MNYKGIRIGLRRGCLAGSCHSEMLTDLYQCVFRAPLYRYKLGYTYFCCDDRNLFSAGLQESCMNNENGPTQEFHIIMPDYFIPSSLK